MQVMPCFYSPLTWLVIVSCFISMRSTSRAVSMLADEDPEMRHWAVQKIVQLRQEATTGCIQIADKALRNTLRAILATKAVN